MILQTERLILREMLPSDETNMLRLHSHPQVQQYTGDTIITTLEGIHGKIEEKIAEYKKYGYGRWVAILREEMEFIGWAGLSYLPEFDEIDLGYRFLPEFWGRGLATEASRAILKYGFEELKLNRIIAMALPDNEASIRVMQKAGMQFEKFAPYEPGSKDVVWYALSANDYSKNPAIQT
ncbi:GNAT family N-acetyltransferase [Lentiprolixibacter aurantiacus]|uniref:GNAT family N-acetyltransferase n=1 Tax=Lentiprolixibacter aurantiacus TaxID=2993939 RepID=A0AAE3MNC7_9FLAO|nr:GNAT family N-acetyltransferase [Lentiprolixibacter aurantiacus]MCX2720486.1 GNAT family N-acetyltransferase [Lentiprolixibacter aurantiacus]